MQSYCTSFEPSLGGPIPAWIGKYMHICTGIVPGKISLLKTKLHVK